MEKLIQESLDGLVEVVGVYVAQMFEIPGPDVGTGSGRPSETLSIVAMSLDWLVLVVGSISMMAAVMRLFWTLEAGTESRVIIRMMINVVASSALVIGMTSILLRATDSFSTWALYRISGFKQEELNSGEKFAKTLLGGNAMGDNAEIAGLSLIGLVLILVSAIGAFMQMAWMIVRSPLIITTVAFIPLFAASSGFRAGQERFTKALMFLLACVLYKPVAAVIYGLGLRMLQAQNHAKDPLMEFLWGTTLLLLIGVAGPAMIKFFVPEAGAGTSNAFSGAAGIAAAGAAVYGAASLGASLATGGAAAAPAAGAAVSTGPPPGGGDTGQPSPSNETKQLPPAPDSSGGGDKGPVVPPAPDSGSGGGPVHGSGGPSASPGGAGTGAQSNGGSDEGAKTDQGPPADEVDSSGGVGGADESGAPVRDANEQPSSGGGSVTPSGESSTDTKSDSGGSTPDSNEHPATPPATGAPVEVDSVSTHGSAHARLAGSRARKAAQVSAEFAGGLANSTGAAVQDMNESAESGVRRGTA